MNRRKKFRLFPPAHEAALIATLLLLGGYRLQAQEAESPPQPAQPQAERAEPEKAAAEEELDLERVTLEVRADLLDIEIAADEEVLKQLISATRLARLKHLLDGAPQDDANEQPRQARVERELRAQDEAARMIEQVKKEILMKRIELARIEQRIESHDRKEEIRIGGRTPSDYLRAAEGILKLIEDARH